MTQHQTPRSSRSETGSPGSHGQAATSGDQTRGAASLAGVRADQREATKVVPSSQGRLGDDISQFARNRPVPALVIAAGLGFLIGRRTMPRRSAGPPTKTGGGWPPRFQSQDSSESGVQFPP
jgi:hypothetical protein